MRRWAEIVLVLGAIALIPTRAEAHPMLDTAVASYEEADFQEALHQFNRAARNADLSVEELLRLFEMRALVHHALGDEVSMRADLTRLAAVRPSYSLSRMAPPPVRRAFSEIAKANRGDRAVELVIEDETVNGKPVIIATVLRAPDGLVDHVGLRCRVGAQDKSVARTAKGTEAKLVLPKAGSHGGCEASARTRQGGVLFATSIEGTRPKASPIVIQNATSSPMVDDSSEKKRKKWPWIVAAVAVAAGGGVAAGVILSKRSNDPEPGIGAVGVSW